MIHICHHEICLSNVREACISVRHRLSDAGVFFCAFHEETAGSAPDLDENPISVLFRQPEQHSPTCVVIN